MGWFGGTDRQRATVATVLLAVLGAWVGHGAEALRLRGTAGLVAAVTGPVHLYMLPTGALLGLAVALLGLRCWRLSRELGRRLIRARRLLRHAWRGGASEAPPPAPVTSPGPGWLLALLAPAQVALYVVQENLEAVVAGGPAPGLGVLGGAHRSVVLVHLGVAGVLAGLVALVCHLLERRRRLAVRCERLVRALLLLRGRRPAARRRGLLWLRTPHERLGAQLWCRPPPLASL